MVCKAMLKLTSPAISATFTTLGARLVSLVYDGVDVVMGGGTDHQILTGDWTTGAVCGRHAGRIAGSSYAYEGTAHQLVPNVGTFQLHGGPDNFAVRHWAAETTDNGIRFSLTSPDGDQGFPGELTASATYTLKGSVLALEIEARTSKATLINLTNHAYWNLMGSNAAFDHELEINADAMVPLDDDLLVKGDIRSVDGTRFDFRKLRLIGEDYDNCWVLTGKRGVMKHGLTLRDPQSGRRMEVWTSEAGLQVYTCFHWNGVFPGKRGALQQYAAVAIEPQNLPDAANHAHFPNGILKPGAIYRNRMEWRFG
jgi:aldose 1-epimerase